MAADLMIYAIPDDPELVKLALAFQRSCTTVDDGDDSEWAAKMLASGDALTESRQNEVYDRVFGWADDSEPRDALWIGRVSWLKASLDDNGVEKWIPSTVWRVSELLEGVPVLTPGLASEVVAAFNLPDDSFYSETTFHRVQMTWERSSSRRHWRSGRYEGAYRDWEERGGKMTKPSRVVWRGGADGNAMIVRNHGKSRARARVVKRWLAAHQGMRMVVISE